MSTIGQARKRVYSPRRFESLVEWVMQTGQKSNPRGLPTVEVLNANLVVKDPRDRLVYDPARKMNLGFAIAEAAMVLAGKDDLESITPFVPNMADFSLDGKTIAGAYGPRLRTESIDQLYGAIDKLKTDENTRQAIVSIHRTSDLRNPDHVVPCTLTLQFLIRENKLHMITNMRSNDVIWGLTYDLFVFTMIQEFIAGCVKKDMGTYFHNAGSLHLYYERDKRIIEGVKKRRVQVKMKKIYFDTSTRLYEGLTFAKDLSTRAVWDFCNSLLDRHPQQTQMVELIATMRYFLTRTEAPYEAVAALSAITDPALKKVIKLWPIKKGE